MGLIWLGEVFWVERVFICLLLCGDRVVDEGMWRGFDGSFINLMNWVLLIISYFGRGCWVCDEIVVLVDIFILVWWDFEKRI